MSMPLYRVTIADKIKAYRRGHALSQREFGELLGVSAQAVCKWEQGICYPDLALLPQLAHVMACSIDDFFETVGDRG